MCFQFLSVFAQITFFGQSPAKSKNGPNWQEVRELVGRKSLGLVVRVLSVNWCQLTPTQAKTNRVKYKFFQDVSCEESVRVTTGIAFEVQGPHQQPNASTECYSLNDFTY